MVSFIVFTVSSRTWMCGMGPGAGGDAGKCELNGWETGCELTGL
jgi:hypothetical protein